MKRSVLILTIYFGLTNFFGQTLADFKDGAIAYSKQDYATAIEEFKLAGELGDSDAQIELGLMYYWGTGTPIDYRKAFKWFKKAAENGNREAQFNVGIIFEYGQGTLKDYKQAISWFRRSAEQNFPSAQLSLGTMYIDGHGVDKNLSKAKEWLLKAYENPESSSKTIENVEHNWNTFELWDH